jgi:hypothetical protein
MNVHIALARVGGLVGLVLAGTLPLGGCAARPAERAEGGEIGVRSPAARAELSAPEAGFRVVSRYLTDGYQLVTPETFLLEPVVPPGTPTYQLLVGPARDGSALRADVHNSAVTLSLQNGFAIATGTQPIVVVKRVVAAAEGTVFLVEGDKDTISIVVLNAAPDKPVRVYFESDNASRAVLVRNWQYVQLSTTAGRVPPARDVPIPGTGLADTDGIGELLKFSYAKRVQTGQTIRPDDADAAFVAALGR